MVAVNQSEKGKRIQLNEKIKCRSLDHSSARSSEPTLKPPPRARPCRQCHSRLTGLHCTCVGYSFRTRHRQRHDGRSHEINCIIKRARISTPLDSRIIIIITIIPVNLIHRETLKIPLKTNL